MVERQEEFPPETRSMSKAKGKTRMAKKRVGGVAAPRAVRGHAWALVERQIHDSIAATAATGRQDEAFQRFVRSALNGETDRITGWGVPVAHPVRR
jgi:hypothetical protein